MNTFGILVGIAMLACIGLGFAWVIRVERYLGYLWWPYFILLGVVLIFASLFITSQWGAGLAGILGASIVWGATELKEQAVRAELGWFPFRAAKVRPPLADKIEHWKAPHL